MTAIIYEMEAYRKVWGAAMAMCKVCGASHIGVFHSSDHSKYPLSLLTMAAGGFSFAPVDKYPVQV